MTIEIFATPPGRGQCAGLAISYCASLKANQIVEAVRGWPMAFALRAKPYFEICENYNKLVKL